jgi:hypothetical protein
MTHLKAQLRDCLGACIQQLGEYCDALDSSSAERKEQIAEYYRFSQRLTASLCSLDALSARLAKQIQAADSQNDYARVQELSSLFEASISARVAAEEFLVSAEITVKAQDDGRRNMENSANILIKKLFLIKSSI